MPSNMLKNSELPSNLLILIKLKNKLVITILKNKSSHVSLDSLMLNLEMLTN